jgi:aminobenzoyl-glutamate utilization protein B
VIDLLTDEKLLQSAKDEWAKQMEGRVYKSPLPPELKPPLDQLKKQSH